VVREGYPRQPPRVVLSTRDAFRIPGGMSITFLQADVGVGDAQAKAPNDSQDRAYTQTQSEARSRTPRALSWAKVAASTSTHGCASLEHLKEVL
jgi:hypothetical protein